MTTPKFPPPPRSAHSSSGFSVTDARTSAPSAVTSSAASRLSHATPCLRSSQPEPPPQREARDAGGGHAAAGGGETVLPRGGVDLRPGRAAADAHAAAPWIYLHGVDRADVDDDPVAQRLARHGVAAGAD